MAYRPEFISAVEEEQRATIARLTAELAEVEALELQHGAVIERLLAERDALIGAAYEAAAKVAFNAIAKHPLRTMLTNTDNATMLELSIMALTPTNATAALDRIKAEAELSGWKRGRDDAAARIEQNSTPCSPAFPSSWSADQISHYESGQADAASSFCYAIRALPIPSPADLAERLGGGE